MKIISRCFLVIFFIVLTGCSERALTFDRVYPDTTKLDAFREIRQLEIEEEMRNLPKTIMEKKPEPRPIILNGGLTERNSFVFLYANQYCWEYNVLDCERIIPVHPDDIKNFNLATISIKANNVINVYAYKEGNRLPFPNRLEVYLFDKNKNLNLYQVIDSTSNSFDFTSPSKPGVYNLLFKAYYQWEVDGISYHPVQVYVR